MRLISLSANQKSFKTIVFNKTGASFILAKQDNPEQHDKSKTYNGVGKSLLVALVDFCLGASMSNKITQSLQNTLPEWVFTLNIEANDQVFEIVRQAKSPKQIMLNGELLSLIDFYEKLTIVCFDIPKNFQYLSYRALLPFFLRPAKQSYLYYDEPIKVGSPYQKQLYNAFLLGLDVNLSQTKMALKKQLDSTNTLHSYIKNDPILQQFFEGTRDSSLALADLDEKISQLEQNLQAFEVADDYYQIKQQADTVKQQIETLHNQLVLKKNTLDNIAKSLKISPDVKREDIQKIYTEAKLVFQPSVEKQLIELETFFDDLTVNRTKRLQQQKQKVDTEISALEQQSARLKKELDQHLQFLDAHQALDIFVKMNNQLAELQQQRDKLKDYEKLQLNYEHKKTALRKEMIVESEKTLGYLEDIKQDIRHLMEYFRVLVKQFYPDAVAGITVHNNDGKNQLRYKIEAKIQSDASDGINSVKLFCYDMTLLMQGSHHDMGFIFHDSRLFSDIDEVHCDELFTIVKAHFLEKQYIASINQNQLNALSTEAKAFVTEHIVRELTDDSDSGKLLGMTVELEYA